MAIGQNSVETIRTEAARTEWLERLEGLVSQVKTSVEKSQWKTRRVTKTLHERPFGEYKVPVLLMEKEAVQAVLNPVGRFIAETDGGVDLYLTPAYDDIARLYFGEAEWVVNYCPAPDVAGSRSVLQGVEMPIAEGTIRTILDDMISHA